MTKKTVEKSSTVRHAALGPGAMEELRLVVERLADVDPHPVAVIHSAVAAEPPPQGLVEALRAIDIRDRQHHDLEPGQLVGDLARLARTGRRGLTARNAPQR